MTDQQVGQQEPEATPTPVPAQALTRRITGIETEFGITLTLDGSRRLGPDEIARYMFLSLIHI